MRAVFFILLILCSTCVYAMEKPHTNVSSFVHQITLKRDSSETRVTQWVAPVSLHVPLANGDIHFRSAAMLIHLDAADDHHVWGALNTDIQGQWSLGKFALLDLNTSLPSGKRALAAADAGLAQQLARNDLNFPVKTFGQGLDFGGAFSFVRHRGFWSGSAGVGYQFKGAYEPIAGVTDYKPGDEISGSLGFDYSHGSFVYRLSAAGSYYLTDRQNKVVVFQNGKQILLQGAVLYTGRRWRVKAELTEIARLKNRNNETGAFLFETRDSNGNDLRANLEGSWTLARFLTLYGTRYGKTLTANANPAGSALYQGDAHLVSWGGGIALSLGPYHLDLLATKIGGKAEDKSIDLSAFGVHCAFSALF